MHEPAPARTDVVDAALTLFQQHGYEQTSVEQIARAAGVSRSTFFRQFGGKEDVVFADHEALLTDLHHFLSQGHSDPWRAVCDAAERVFTHFSDDPDVARRRYEVVRTVPVLREREIVTVFRYERLFHDYLRTSLPGVDPIDAVAFTASVTAIHNHVLRQLLRGTKKVSPAVLHEALEDLRRRFGVSDEPMPAQRDDVVVAVFPRSMPAAEIARRVQIEMTRPSGTSA